MSDTRITATAPLVVAPALVCQVTSSWDVDVSGAVRKAGRKAWGPAARPRPQARAEGLSDGAVQEIRRRAATGTTRRALATEFGLSYDTVADVVARRSWAHVPDPEPAAEPASRPAARRRKGGKAAKLAPEQVQEIRRRVAYGETRRAVAIAFGVAYDTVSGIVQRRWWQHVPDAERLPPAPRQPRPAGQPHRKLDVQRVLEIRRRADTGERTKDLAAAFGVSAATISAIRMRRIWTSVPEERREVRRPLPREDWCDGCQDWHGGGCP